MALKEVPPLTKEQYKFVVDTLQKEEKNPSKARISRIKAARIRAANMKVVYH
jgi:mRNA-degrading endonuclease RelE of RelBE toxin-antitoxin system